MMIPFLCHNVVLLLLLFVVVSSLLTLSTALSMTNNNLKIRNGNGNKMDSSNMRQTRVTETSVPAGNVFVMKKNNNDSNNSILVTGYCNEELNSIEANTSASTHSNNYNNNNNNNNNNDNSNYQPRRQFFLQLGGITGLVASTTSTILTSTNPSYALSPEQAAKDYNTYSSSYNELDGGKASMVLGIDEARRNLFQKAHGNVLEIGAGTGLNLAKYNMNQIDSLTLVDISSGMLQQAKETSIQLSIPSNKINFIQADVTSASAMTQTFGTERVFDTIVDSFSLCVMGNNGAKQCLAEISKLVKTKDNGGQVLLLENTKSANTFLGLYQDMTANAAAVAGGKGCVYNQDVAALIATIPGMEIEKEELFATGLFRSFECVVNA